MTRDGVWDRWQPLPPDDPFVSDVGLPGEVIYNGIEAVDWDERKTPGISREASERLLLVTSKRIIVIRKQSGGMFEIAYDDLDSIVDRKMGMQGFVIVEVGSDMGRYRREWSMHKDVAPVVAKKIREFWAATA